MARGPRAASNVQRAGPFEFNLSLAALLAPTSLRARFFERNAEFQWHPGLLFPEATVQVSFLKDLVTLADPTSRYSFLAFLHAKRRFYRFINTGQARVHRLEFNQYLQWVAGQLDNVEFGTEVRMVTLEANHFSVRLSDRTLSTTNLVLGTGLVPNIPPWARPYLGRELFHSIDYLDHPFDVTGKLVAVVGGGQSGAEVVFHLLRDNDRLPMQLMWISSRGNFLPLDESPFTNELFTPAYSDYFFGLPREQRDLLLGEQRLASDGVSEALLQRVYNRLYELEFLERRDGRNGGGQGTNRLARLMPGQDVVDMRPGAPGCELVMRSRWGDAQRVRADIVVLATGFAYDLPEAMRPLADRLSWDRDGFPVRGDFSIVWDGPANLRIYAQDAARHMRGVADPNLSLMAWRSAIIANSLLGKTAYEVAGESSALDFQEIP